MNLKRTATIGVVGCALAAWLAAAGTSGVRVPAPLVVATTPIEMSGEALAKEIARLHERLRPTAAPRAQGRNLFQFSARPARVAPAPAGKAALSEATALPAPLPPPPLKLAGIAEDAGPNGPVRTAIISGPGQLFLVKEGETVASRYRVVKISADVAELVDTATDTPFRLGMR